MEANERASKSTRAERGLRGFGERACRGVRGVKPLGADRTSARVSPRERSGACGAPASESVGESEG